MNDDDSDEFTVYEMIELQLCAINAVIEAVPGGDPIFLQGRDCLASLLKKLDRGEILPEYAEVKCDQVKAMMTKWLRENEIPRDPPGAGP